MSKTLIIIASLVLVLHGLIHLMGTAVYMKLAIIKGLPYKTTLLGGGRDLGEGGTRVFGVLWAMAAIGFIGSAVALLAGWGWWLFVLVGVTLFSLLLTALDWSNTYAGAIINIAILALLWLWPRIASWFPQ